MVVGLREREGEVGESREGVRVRERGVRGGEG
jgi:hypothetical protein